MYALLIKPKGNKYWVLFLVYDTLAEACDKERDLLEHDSNCATRIMCECTQTQEQR